MLLKDNGENLLNPSGNLEDLLNRLDVILRQDLIELEEILLDHLDKHRDLAEL